MSAQGRAIVTHCTKDNVKNQSPAAPPQPATPVKKSASLAFRRDIQGLRAVAVLLVVLDHAFGWPTGGFVGVDVFYVISGYLITGLLLRESSENGRISFVAFYARRVRRIVPAALAVLVVTVTLAFLIWYPPRAIDTLLDAIASATFVENWHLISQGTDYLQASGATSPLQHYWSLSVEEQFYAFWPVVLTGVLILARPRWRRTLVLGCMVVIAITSLGYSAERTLTMPSEAYFDSAGRAWELLAGAIIAGLGPFIRGDRRAQTIVGTAGLLILLASSVILTPASLFPWPFAILPVAGTATVIWAAGTGGALGVLSSRPAQYIGRISYSLYLWHFPVLIFVQSVTHSIFASAAAVVATFVLADLSYRFIEKPALKIAVLKRWSNLVHTRGSRAQAIVPLTVVVLIIAMTAIQWRGPAVLRDGAGLAAAFRLDNPGPATSQNAPTLSTTQLKAAVSAAVKQTSWSSGATAMIQINDANAEAPAMQTTSPGCRNSVGANPALVCSYGPTSARSRVLVIGDSVALSWVPAVQAVFQPRGWRVLAMGFASCPFIDVSTMPRIRDSSFPGKCAESRDAMRAEVARIRPTVLIISNAEAYYSQLTDQKIGSAAASEWQHGIERTLAGVAALAGRTVVLSNPPVAADPRSCITRLTGPTACLRPVSNDYKRMALATKAAVLSASRDDRVQYINAASWFCSDNECPAQVGSTLLRIDETHLTERGAILAAGALKEAIRP